MAQSIQSARLSFQSSESAPRARKKVLLLPPFGSKGETHSLARWWRGGLNSDEMTDSLVLYVCVLFLWGGIIEMKWLYQTTPNSQKYKKYLFNCRLLLLKICAMRHFIFGGEREQNPEKYLVKQPTQCLTAWNVVFMRRNYDSRRSLNKIHVVVDTFAGGGADFINTSSIWQILLVAQEQRPALRTSKFYINVFIASLMFSFQGLIASSEDF